MSTKPEARQEAPLLQKWICSRELKFPPTPDRLMTELRACLLKAKQARKLSSSQDEITHKLLSKAREANAQLNQLPDFLIGDVDDVARQGFRACMRGDTICVPGVVNQAAMLASRSTPKWLVRRLGGLMARQAL